MGTSQEFFLFGSGLSRSGNNYILNLKHWDVSFIGQEKFYFSIIFSAQYLP